MLLMVLKRVCLDYNSIRGLYKMRILGNVIWFCFGGFLVALFNFIVGVILIALVITAPIGMGLVQFSKFCLFPFTTAMVSKSEMDIKQNSIWRMYSGVLKIIYIVSFGWLLVLITIPSILIGYLLIITIPAAIAMSKSLGTILNPVGKICVPISVRDELEKRRATEIANKLTGK